ncbi:uncharacterized protein LOC111297704 [Durio zibethinus]|uniref:Uncharacterized protein LOC111297704 n=1 Tax=Durio zibethinus TaxID=66656 RepID=A0A6P5Z6U4_DURZI|nr:uncharacterized protein LOC111297704 [Durio zibethinus]
MVEPPHPSKCISWSPPPQGVWKINVDESAIGKPVPTSVGGVARDVRRIFSKNIGIKDSNLAEFIAVFEALSIMIEAKLNPLSEIIIESDSKYNATFNKLLNLYADFKKITYIRVFRDANHFADALARMGVNRNSDVVP